MTPLVALLTLLLTTVFTMAGVGAAFVLLPVFLADVLSIGEVFQLEREWFPEVMEFVPCAACHELTAWAYLRVVGDRQVCIPCSGYER